jgi:ribulose-bisphosphate carboxylase large chain
MSRIIAKYLIETGEDLEQAAATMAGEQSAGTFVRVPGETDELRERFGARVENITRLGTVARPTLGGARQSDDGRYARAEVTISWNLENMGTHLPNLISTVSGNLYELGAFSGLKLLDFDVPEDFAGAYPGPQFGITGTRELSGVEGRPVVGTIIKPSVGMSPDQTAERVALFCRAGLDFVKDDELQGDSPHSPFAERVEKVMKVVNDHARTTGTKLMFAFNISGDVEQMRERHDLVLEHGGTCVMVNLNSVGVAGMLEVRKFSQLPVHGHRNGWGGISRCEVLGMEFTAYQKIWRLAGVDHLHTNGLRNKFCESDESVIASAKACLAPMLGGYELMPVISSGQWAGQAVDTYRAIGSVDLMYLCGGGIVGHPGGMEAGVKSVQQGWEAALAGEELEAYAKSHEELREALAFYGKR